MVAVTITGLACEQMYTIVAGGINIINGTMERILDGPRFRGMDYSASACSMNQTQITSTSETAIVCIVNNISPCLE